MGMEQRELAWQVTLTPQMVTAQLTTATPAG
jgi:hypothetical protein